MIIQKWFFVFDCLNLLKNNPIKTKMSQELFQYTLNIFYLLFWKSGYKMSNGIEWRHMTYFSWNRCDNADVSKSITWKMLKRIIFENNNTIAF